MIEDDRRLPTGVVGSTALFDRGVWGFDMEVACTSESNAATRTHMNQNRASLGPWRTRDQAPLYTMHTAKR